MSDLDLERAFEEGDAPAFDEALAEVRAELKRLRDRVLSLQHLDDAHAALLGKESELKAELEHLRANKETLLHSLEVADADVERLQAALTAYQRNLGDEREENERLREENKQLAKMFHQEGAALNKLYGEVGGPERTELARLHRIEEATKSYLYGDGTKADLIAALEEKP